MTPATAVGFWVLAVLAAGSGLAVVLSRNVFHAVLGLAVASLAVAGLMLTLGAEFLALVLVLVYVGAVVVIAVFAVMLTGRFRRPVLPPSNELKALGGATSLALLALITGVVLAGPARPAGAEGVITLTHLGNLLLTDYVLPFEFVSILLLAALVGAIVIAREEESEP